MKDRVKRSQVIETYSLILVDLLCTVLSFLTSVLCRYLYDVNGPLDKKSAIVAGCTLMIGSVLYNILIEGHRAFFKRANYTEFVSVVRGKISVLVVTLVLMFFMLSSRNMSRMVFMLYIVTDVPLTFLGRTFLKKWMLLHYKRSGAGNKVLVITKSAECLDLINKLNLNMPWDKQLVAICMMDEEMPGFSIYDIPVVANEENLYEEAKKMALDEVLIDLPDYSEEKLKELISNLQEMGAVCNCCIHTCNVDGSSRGYEMLGNLLVVSYEKTRIDYRRTLIKRCIDIAGALVGILVTALVTPFVALAIKIESPGPVFFSQERVGKNGRRFKIYKFRSMYIDAEERKKELMEKNQMSGLMFKMDDDPRVTRVGKFIRKTSIDELPQFYNILIGQMSLVGTRPPTVDEFERYSLHYKRRLSMTPGLTGMWQVSGRSSITDFDEVVKLDLEYIDNWSIGLDIKILFMTIFTVLFRRGAK